MKIADMHCDTIEQIWYSRLRGEPLCLSDTEGSSRELHIDLKKLVKGDYTLQNFAMFVNLSCPKDFDGRKESITEKWSLEEKEHFLDPWYQLQEMIKVYHEEIALNRDRIGEVRTWADYEKNQAEGRLSAVLTVEEGAVLQGDISRLPRLYDEGVRMMTLTWNYYNELGCPNEPLEGYKEDYTKYFAFVPRNDNGLTPKGFEALECMESLGIIPDVSHLSDAGFYDVARTVKGPFVASHSNARALAGCNRNLTDDMIRTIAEHGGVIGLNFCPAFLDPQDREDKCRCTCEILARHARHIMNVGGREVIGLGTDFDGIGHENLEMQDASGMQMLPEYLLAHGFSLDETDAILSKNVLRLYKEALS